MNENNSYQRTSLQYYILYFHKSMFLEARNALQNSEKIQKHFHCMCQCLSVPSSRKNRSECSLWFRPHLKWIHITSNRSLNFRSTSWILQFPPEMDSSPKYSLKPNSNISKSFLYFRTFTSVRSLFHECERVINLNELAGRVFWEFHQIKVIFGVDINFFCWNELIRNSPAFIKTFYCIFQVL